MGLRFGLLGPTQVFAGPRELDLGTTKQRTLLAALLLRPDRVVPLGELVTALWDGEPPRSAVANLRTYAARLRRRLAEPGRILTRHPGYLLRVDGAEVDVAVFTERARAGRRALEDGDLARAEDDLAAAVGLWRGAAAEDLPRTLGLAPLLQALEERRRDAAEDLARVRILRGSGTELVGELRASVAADPVRERQWANLILALHHAGDTAGALEAYRAARRALRDHLGIDPGEELALLHRRILDGSSLPGIPAPRRAAAARPVPRVGDPVGRDEELAALTGLLAPGPAPVLAAVHGPVGSGKSALAALAAAEAERWYPDGHLWVDLESPGGCPRTPSEVLAELLRGLGAESTGLPWEARERMRLLRDRGAGRRLLFVLDNAVDEAQVRPLIATWEGAATLVTSRRHLSALDGAGHVGIGALCPDDAVALLARMCGAERVRADPASAERIAAFCDHLPLPLWIAGRRLQARREWPLRAFADLLDDERHRLDALSCADRSVRAAFATAFAPLRGGGRGTERLAADLFERLGVRAADVFGPREAADLADCDTVTATAVLGCLADARLIEPVGANRYRLPGLLRLYAAEQGARSGRRPAVVLPYRGARPRPAASERPSA